MPRKEKTKKRMLDETSMADHLSDDDGPQALQTLRPSKLPKFSGDGDAEAFIREAKLMMRLQPMRDTVAAAWLLGALEGQARQQILSMEAEEIDTPAKIFAVLEQHWGEQRDSSTLAAAFYKRQQGLAETVCEYAAALRVLWAKTNATKSDTLSIDTLRDTFVNGLNPASLRRDMKRFLREKPILSFKEATKEAQRWMREDGGPEMAIEQATTMDPDAIHRLEAQVAALTTENVAIKRQLDEQHAATVPKNWYPHSPGQHAPRQTNQQFKGRDLHGPRQQNLTCWWCQRQGHREAECRAKQTYQQRRAQPQRSGKSHLPAQKQGN